MSRDAIIKLHSKSFMSNFWGAVHISHPYCRSCNTKSNGLLQFVGEHEAEGVGGGVDCGVEVVVGGAAVVGEVDCGVEFAPHFDVGAA